MTLNTFHLSCCLCKLEVYVDSFLHDSINFPAGDKYTRENDNHVSKCSCPRKVYSCFEYACKWDARLLIEWVTFSRIMKWQDAIAVIITNFGHAIERRNVVSRLRIIMIRNEEHKKKKVATQASDYLTGGLTKSKKDLCGSWLPLLNCCVVFTHNNLHPSYGTTIKLWRRKCESDSTLYSIHLHTICKRN